MPTVDITGINSMPIGIEADDDIIIPAIAMDGIVAAIAPYCIVAPPPFDRIVKGCGPHYVITTFEVNFRSCGQIVIPYRELQKVVGIRSLEYQAVCARIVPQGLTNVCDPAGGFALVDGTSA